MSSLKVDEYIDGFHLAAGPRIHARERPAAPALVFDDLTYSYREFDLICCRAANALKAEGIGVGDRVAFIGKNVPEYFTFHYGAAKLNAVMVGVNWRLTPKEMAFILDDAEVKVVLVDEEFLGHVKKMDLPGNPLIIAIGGDGAHPDYSAWIADQPEDDPMVEVDLDDTAVQVYTSGTTGLPKGAELSHRNIGASLWAWSQINGVTEKGVILQVLPMFHIGGSSAVYLGLWIGCSNIVRRELDPQDMVISIAKHKVTHIMAVPAILQMFPSLPGVDDLELSSVELVQYGASPISEEVLNATMDLFECPLLQTYGLTEATGPVTFLPPEDHDPNGPREYLMRSAGKPLPGAEVRIVDTDGNEVPEGDVGEIWTRSYQTMKGYWKNPEATAEAYPEGRDEKGLGWMATGDAGALEGGYLYIRDRVKDMIISGGENIYPAEIENVLMSHPAVLDVAVIGIPNEKWGESPLAAIVPAKGESPTLEDIVAFCADRLARYKLPKAVELMAEIPRNPSGKIQKVELRKPYWDGHKRGIN